MRKHRAFSLVELLVVLGLIVLGLGGIGLTRREGDRGLTLRSGQAQVLALLRAARAEAIARQVPVRVLIPVSHPSTAGTTSENSLHCLQIASREEGEAVAWVPDDPAVCLPPGIFVVPPVVTADDLEAGTTWPAGDAAPSSILGGADILMLGRGGRTGAYYSIEFGADGMATPHAARLVIGTARPDRGRSPRFDNPGATRGVAVRAAGGIEMLPSLAGLWNLAHDP